MTVHSLGAADTELTTIALVDQNGSVLVSAPVPRIGAPADLLPRRLTITLAVPAGTRLAGCSIVLDQDAKMKEITRVNNQVRL